MEKLKKYEDRLMAALDFSELDLENNRAGLMTYHQAMRLRSARFVATLSWTIPLLLGVCGLSFGVSVMSLVGSAALEVALLPMLFVLGVSGWLYAFFGMRSSRLNDDLRENRVSVVEGRVDLSVVAGNNSAVYALDIGSIRFPLKHDGFLAFKNGDPYRIYYTAHSKRILSVEWLREDENSFEEEDLRAALDIEPDGELMALPR